MSVTVSADDIKRVKGLGFLQQKGTDTFNARTLTRNGKITVEEARKVAADWLANAEHALAHAKEIYNGVEDEAISAAMDEILGEMIKRAIKKELEA